MEKMRYAGRLLLRELLKVEKSQSIFGGRQKHSAIGTNLFNEERDV